MYKMPRKYAKKGLKKPKSKSASRRRLQPVALSLAGLGVAAKTIQKGYRSYRTYKRNQRVSALRSFNTRLEQTDGITTAPVIVIGKQRVVSFQEKVARTIRPPFMFKRNYQFSAECESGRKAFFAMECNLMTTADLSQDISAYKSALSTNTSSPDSTLSGNSFHDGARFYVDKLTEKIRMVNSSSNTVIGKVHLIAYKRDLDGNYGATGALTNPICMAMYYSTLGGVSLQSNGAGNENTVGNGWSFDQTTAGLNYSVTYQMPGSSVNASGVCAKTDLAFSLFAPHINDRMSFFFRKVKSTNFALKPGQQLDQSLIFNDLPTIHREQTEFAHVAGVSYSIVVEFSSGIVGDSTALSSIVSTGTAQLSVIRESVRILGLKNLLKSNVVLQTAQLSQIATATQVIINADTGVGLSGAVIDS